jgi:hypothetical protein
MLVYVAVVMFPGVHMYVYGAVPPVGVIVAVPLFAPKQVMFVEEIVAASTAGSVTVKDCVPVQPFASVTVSVYVPAQRPVAVAEVPPDGAQLYVYAGVPPITVEVMLPLHTPKQETFVTEPEMMIGVGSVMMNVCVVVQPFASVTVTV